MRSNCFRFIIFFSIFSNHVLFCNAILEKRSNNLVFFQSEYAQHNDAILLVVIPAAQAPEVSSAKALRVAKEYDGECGFPVYPESRPANDFILYF